LPDTSPLGLRERKKLKTRTAIQREAMRLFLEKGFQATTVEDIAAAVEISPSTFFNYFPSKEDVAFQDDLDPLILEAFNAQPPHVHPVRALRNALRDVFTGIPPEEEELIRQRLALVAGDADLRGAMLSQFASLVDQVAEILAGRTGRTRDDFQLHNLSGALLGVLMSSILAAASTPGADLVELMDAAMAHLEAGLPLD
jgi:AcrR family transcriptional regulator